MWSPILLIKGYIFQFVKKVLGKNFFGDPAVQYDTVGRLTVQYDTVGRLALCSMLLWEIESAQYDTMRRLTVTNPFAKR